VPSLEPGIVGGAQHLTQGRIARVLFCEHGGKMVLLHAFIKKTQKTPVGDLELALRRKKEVT